MLHLVATGVVLVLLPIEKRPLKVLFLLNFMKHQIGRGLVILPGLVLTLIVLSVES